MRIPAKGIKKFAKVTCVVLSILALLLVASYYSDPTNANPSAHQQQPVIVQAPEQTSTEASCTANADELLKYINEERARLGVQQLHIDQALMRSSRLKFDDMVAAKYVGHDRPDGVTADKLILAQGVRGTISEDIGLGDPLVTDEVSGNTASRRDWDNFTRSAPHYESLTNALFSRVGIYTACTDFVPEVDTYNQGSATWAGHRVARLAVVHLASADR